MTGACSDQEWTLAIDAAVRLGLASQAAGRALIASEGAPSPERLAAGLALPLDVVDGLLRMVRHLPRTPAPTPGEAPTLTTGGEAPPVAPSDATFIDWKIAGHEILSELGHGGMGVVYKARHLGLGRLVALKVLIAGEGASEEMLERFQREARSAARLQHPNIVPVYEVGQDGKRRFFTMQYVEGATLSELARKRALTPRRALDVTRKIALALDLAHRNGILHRDVKPSNILIGEDGEPRITDFGLAKDLDAGPGTTLTGVSLGTPNYAAPEQLAGETRLVGPASDVYSLGATLYEALTGAAPFTGSSVFAIVVDVLSKEPPPPRSLNPSIHRDIETICLKAMQKEPARRYPTARAFADDIERYLDGLPIEARPITRLQRAGRWARRNPLPSALLAALLIVGGVFGGVEWRASLRAREAERARAAMVEQYLRELARSGRALVDAALARRALGDLAGMAAHARDLDGPVDELIGRAPDLAQPWYYRGRMQRALGEVEAAERSQTWAIDRARGADATDGSRDVLGPALYERGVLRRARYVRLREARRQALLMMQGDAGASGPLLDADIEAALPELRALKVGLEEDLRGAASSVANGSALAEAAEGLLLLSESKEGAREALERALTRDPRLEEALTGLASLAESDGLWVEAADRYARGRLADRGLLAYALGEARCLVLAAWACARRGEDAASLLQRALAALDEAAAVAGERSPLLAHRAMVLRSMGEASSQRGEDPMDLLRRAVDAARGALALSPADAAATQELASAWTDVGAWESSTGRDATAAFQEAITAFDRVVALEPDSPYALNNRANALQEFGAWRAARGEDPLALQQEAIKAFRRAAPLCPLNGHVELNEAASHLYVGEWLRAHGGDPTEAFQAGIDLLGPAAEAGSGIPELHANLGALWLSLGTWRRDRGEDPGDALREAMTACSRAIEVNPKLAQGPLNRGLAHLALGRELELRGQDPCEEYKKGIEDEARARALNPRLSAAALHEGVLCRAIGNWTSQRGQDPLGWYERAAKAIEAAIAGCPSQAGPRVELSMTLIQRAEAQLARKADPTAALAAALDQARLARAGDPSNHHIPMIEAMSHRTWGDWIRRRREDPSEHYRLAAEAFDQAVALMPTDAVLLNNQGLLHQSLAMLAEESGKDASAEHEAALAAFSKACGLAPGMLEAWCNVGLTALALAELRGDRGEDPLPWYDKAEEALARVVAADPTMAVAWRQLGKARKARGDCLWSRLGDPSKDYELAGRAHKGALSAGPASIEDFLGQGEALQALARYRLSRGEDPARDCEAAMAAYGRGIEAFGPTVALLNNRANTRLILFDWHAGRGEETGPDLERALQDLDAASRADPSVWQVDLNRGVVLDRLGRLEESVQALEKARAASSGNPAVEAILEDVRAKLSPPPR